MKTITKYLTAGIITASIAGVVFADQTSATQSVSQNEPMQTLFQPHFKHNKFKHSFMGSWIVALHHVKQLTPAQAKIVAQAAVILYGDSNMQVGSVTAVSGNNGQQNYQIQITSTAGKKLTTLLMNGNNGKIMPNFQQPPAATFKLINDK